ncbi:MAG TPA: UDP-N-acetylmuramate dehydrogenase, partial [Sedimentisphaerales bacterium]|nr:UDP-N-acetylmuramate dehydrogenase [Sedimentisphaerales bacterium]
VAIYVLGHGSNLLVRDGGVRGAVVKLEGAEFKQTSFDGYTVMAGGGASLGELLLSCVRKGLTGLEACTGIPGSVGGAVRMNAGGRFGDIGSVVERIVVMDRRGEIFERSKPDLRFDYRSANILAPFILNATMQLADGDPEQILKSTQEIWIYKKNNQPLNTKSAGCIFKNPQGQSAGAIIDRSGLKGLTSGGAMVSEKHANFIIAREGCTSADIIKLIETIRKRVNEDCGIELELEVEIWGED